MSHMNMNTHKKSCLYSQIILKQVLRAATVALKTFRLSQTTKSREGQHHDLDIYICLAFPRVFFYNVGYSLSYVGSAEHNQNKQRFLNETFKRVGKTDVKK